MRPGAATFESLSAAAGPSHSTARIHPSAWQSPIPYLFGGLAAMLGLIAFALLILACSYWKLSGYLDAEAENTDSSSPAPANESKKVFVERSVLVIMAGDEKPTYLATPAWSGVTGYRGAVGMCRCEKGGGVELFESGKGRSRETREEGDQRRDDLAREGETELS